MSVRFSSTTVHLDGSLLLIDTEITAKSGSVAGYQIFDDPTGTLIVDGPRSSLAATPRHFEIDLPPEPGEYNIYISPLEENVAWAWQKGEPFLAVDIKVSDSGNSTVTNWRITDKRGVTRRRHLRSFRRALTLPLQAISKNRGLIRTLVRRDIMSRYSGSFGGALWTVLNPLLLMLTYFFVFGIVLNSRIPGDPSRAAFALYYFAGFLPWLAFSEAIGRAPFTMVEHRGFIKKLVFPVEILPVNLVVSGLVTEFFGILLFALALLLLRGHIPATALWFPLLLIPQILLTAGLCWFLSALGVFVRDLAQINGFLITIWFFITPICYVETLLDTLPAMARAIMTGNPIYVLVRAYRAIFLEARSPDWTALAWLTAASLAIFLLGHAWFYKLRKSFADLI